MRERGARDNDAREDWLQLADVARQYYLEDLTQEQIARGIGVSRSHVSRMLKEARECGIVEIRIHHPLRRAPDLEQKLLDALPLSATLVLATAEDSQGAPLEPDASRDVAQQLGALAARYLNERITDHAIVGVGWGSTVYHVVTSGYFRRKQGISVVQLMGSVGGATPDIDGGQVASRLGRALDGKIYYLQAPMVVTDAGVRTGLLRDQHIRKTLELARRASVLLVSVGAVTQASGIFRAGYLTETDLEYIQGQGAVGDICGVYFRQDGSPCSLELEERTIAAGGDAMRRAGLRAGVGWGAAKALPSIGAIRAELINTLVTDEECAREMLNIIAGEIVDAAGSMPGAALAAS
ncbi:MAG: helix-turn-helix domain-containing protein [Chloroflexi bacterium]|nr:helix-turn-helix domain-containing protein [Chloroflexota bacterium]